jgi:hypothetical protein
LSNTKINYKNGDNTVPSAGFLSDKVESFAKTISRRHDIVLQSQMRFGLAFGDFKKRGQRPLCDVFKCYEEENSLLKIGWPFVRLSATNQALSTTIGYEHKLGQSRFSVNAQIDGYSENNTQFSKITQSEIWSYVQARYYFLQKRRIQKHGGSHNLSGLYTAASLISTLQNATYDNQRFYANSIESGPTFGFQQRLFDRGYIDYHFTFSRTIAVEKNYSQGFTEPWSFRPSFKIGFAF